MNRFETKLSVAFAASLVAATILPAFAEGEHHQLRTVDATETLKIRLFDYDYHVNENGLYEYFRFRGANGEGNGYNSKTDEEAFRGTHATVLSKLDSDGYPVFDGRGETNNVSLGYLFGAQLNPNGEAVKGVVEYVPENLPLVYDEATGNYSYHSVSNACDYDTDSNRFVVWDYKEVSTATIELLTSPTFQTGDFLPFNHWDGTIGEKRYDNEQTIVSFNEVKNVNYWFGYRIDTQFVMPPGGVRDGRDVIFSFSGDDDVWVFIDGVLVVDLGGTHGMCTGSINFRTGEVTAHLDWLGATEPSYPTSLTNQFAKAGAEPYGGWSESADGVTFAGYSEHEMKIFYLERGGAVANMNMTFNIQPIPAGTISVAKSVKPATVPAADYGFTLHVETNDVQWIADVTTNGWPSGAELDTNKDVAFTLRAGGGVTDMISFPGIPKDAVVTITENDFEGMADFYGCYLFSTNDWRNGRTATFTNDYEGCVFSFINGYYDVDCLSDLWICDHATPEIGKVRLAVAPDLKTGVDAAGWIGSITNRYAFGLMNPDTGKLWDTNDVRLVGVENGAVWLETDLANVSNAHTKAILYNNQR